MCSKSNEQDGRLNSIEFGADESSVVVFCTWLQVVGAKPCGRCNSQHVYFLHSSLEGCLGFGAGKVLMYWLSLKGACTIQGFIFAPLCPLPSELDRAGQWLGRGHSWDNGQKDVLCHKTLHRAINPGAEKEGGGVAGFQGGCSETG